VKPYVIVTSLIVSGVGLTVPATAQSLKEQVVGTWLLISGMEKTSDGKSSPVWVNGCLILDSTGHVAFFLVGKDQPEDSADRRTSSAPFINFQGLYKLNDAARTLIFTPEIVSSSSLDRVVHKQTVSFNGDTMILTASPVKTSEGEIIPINEWTRAK
jgi:hypothetical protein